MRLLNVHELQAVIKKVTDAYYGESQIEINLIYVHREYFDLLCKHETYMTGNMVCTLNLTGRPVEICGLNGLNPIQAVFCGLRKYQPKPHPFSEMVNLFVEAGVHARAKKERAGEFLKELREL
jgi:hypothetical protein